MSSEGRETATLDVPGRAGHPPSPAPGAASDDVVAGRSVEAWLTWAMPRVRRSARVRATYAGFGPADIDDAAANVMIGLWRSAIPAYDPARGPMDRYLMRCIANRIKSEIHAMIRERNNSRMYVGLDDNRAARVDLGQSMAIDDLADAIVSDPDQFFAAKDAMLLGQFLRSRQITRREIADLLGIAPATLSRAIARLSHRLETIAQEHLHHA